MHKLIKKILNKIESNGFEAYIVGGFVRDLLIGKSSFDVDICTNATPKDLIKIFPGCFSKNLGGIEFKIREFNFEITTYREEIKYEKRKPIKFNYINNLFEDLKRRDFTINAICMNINGDIIDILKGCHDLSNSKIRMIGDALSKINYDPLRILRAIRFATVLDFTIDEHLFKVLKEHSKLVLTLSKTRIKEELDKILLSENVLKGLNLLRELGILKLLGINYSNIIPIKNIEAMYAQISISYVLPFTKIEKENIKNLKLIMKYGKIDNFILYNYGLYLSQIAGELLNINKKVINKIYKDLPIKDKKEINIKAEEIVNILNIDYSKKIGLTFKELENNIISGKLSNKRVEIIKYLENNRERLIS